MDGKTKGGTKHSRAVAIVAVSEVRQEVVDEAARRLLSVCGHDTKGGGQTPGDLGIELTVWDHVWSVIWGVVLPGVFVGLLGLFLAWELAAGLWRKLND